METLHAYYTSLLLLLYFLFVAQINNTVVVIISKTFHGDLCSLIIRIHLSLFYLVSLRTINSAKQERDRSERLEVRYSCLLVLRFSHQCT